MTLSKEQIEHLFTFTQKKFVHWYDLQVELVDHLANKIEAEMANDSTLTFERALGNVYAGFGIFGFAQIVKEREKALRKANNILFWHAVKAEFSWPNLIRSIAILFLIYTTVFVFGLKVTVVFNVIVGAFVLIINRKSFNLRKSFKPMKLHRDNKKRLLMLNKLPSFSLMPLFYFQFLNMHLYKVFDSSIQYSDNQKIIFTGLSFLTTILFLASSKISNSVLQKANKMYPEAFA